MESHANTYTVIISYMDGNKVKAEFSIEGCHDSMTVMELKGRVGAARGIPIPQVWLMKQKRDDQDKPIENKILEEAYRTLGEYGVSSISGLQKCLIWFIPKPPRKDAAQQSWESITDTLDSEGLRYHRSGGDGNCLFRSVSQLVYGDEQCHTVVRACCMEYLQAQALKYQPVLQTLHPEGFEGYLRAKRKSDGSGESWGDEPDIAAMSELYQMPIEVWTITTDPPRLQCFRTYGEEFSAPHIRVCFLGRGHYDALVPVLERNIAPNIAPNHSAPGSSTGSPLDPRGAGEYEREVLQKLSSRSPEEVDGQAQFTYSPIETEILTNVKEESLEQLRKQASKDFEVALKDSLVEDIDRIENQFDDSYLQQAMNESQQQAEKDLEERLATSMKESAKEAVIKQLVEMGVQQWEAEYAAANSSDVESAYAFLNEQRQQQQQAPSEEVQNLMSMLPVTAEQAKGALAACDGDMNAAYMLLQAQW